MERMTNAVKLTAVKKKKGESFISTRKQTGLRRKEMKERTQQHRIIKERRERAPILLRNGGGDPGESTKRTPS